MILLVKKINIKMTQAANNIQQEKELLSKEIVEISFTPILFVIRSMETYEGEV
ncbi:MAG: hypothetical protein JWO03_3427 [Bacteroidetes bacterium]|nr:hypothetical protein [Bacteroidota bacterium]